MPDALTDPHDRSDGSRVSHFTISGRVERWEPLKIGGRVLWVAASVLLAGLGVGVPNRWSRRRMAPCARSPSQFP